MARPLPSSLFVPLLLFLVGCGSVRPEPEPMSDVVARRQTIEAERQAAREALAQSRAAFAWGLAAALAESMFGAPPPPHATPQEVPESLERRVTLEAKAESRSVALAKDCPRRWPGVRAGEPQPGQSILAVACLIGGPGERVAAAEGGPEIRQRGLPDGRRVVGPFKGRRPVAVAFEQGGGRVRRRLSPGPVIPGSAGSSLPLCAPRASVPVHGAHPHVGHRPLPPRVAIG